MNISSCSVESSSIPSQSSMREASVACVHEAFMALRSSCNSCIDGVLLQRWRSSRRSGMSEQSWRKLVAFCMCSPMIPRLCSWGKRRVGCGGAEDGSARNDLTLRCVRAGSRPMWSKAGKSGISKSRDSTRPNIRKKSEKADRTGSESISRVTVRCCNAGQVHASVGRSER